MQKKRSIMADSRTLGQYIIIKKDPLQLVKDCYKASSDYNSDRRILWNKINMAYHGFIEEKFKKFRRSNFHFHKIFPQVETEAARFITGYFTHKPFVAVTTDQEEYVESARQREKVLQYYYDHCPGFYLSTLRLIKYTLLFGTGFRVPSWRKITQKVKKIVPLVISGQTIQGIYDKKDLEETVYEGLWFDTFSPTEVFPDPYAIPGQSRYYIFEEWVAAEEVMARAEEGQFDKSRVSQIPLNQSGQEKIEYHARQAQIGTNRPTGEERIIRLQYYVDADRWITVANGETIIRDVDNPLDNKAIAVTQGIKILDPDSFWPISTAGKLMVNQKLTNLFVNTMSDTALMGSYPIWKYKSNIDPNYLIAVPSQRIPVDSMQDVEVVQLPETKSDLLVMKAMIETNFEEITGYFASQKGYSNQRNTATSDTIFAQQGDKRIQADVMNFEQMTLLPEAKIIAGIVEQMMPPTIEMMIGGFGLGNYQKLSKDAIRGEFNYRVAGISEAINRAVTREQMLQLYEIAANSQQYVRLMNGAIAPVPLQDNYYALTQLYEAFGQPDAKKYTIRPEVFGMPLSNDVIATNPSQSIPGVENMAQHPITGAFSNNGGKSAAQLDQEMQIQRNAL